MNADNPSNPTVADPEAARLLDAVALLTRNTPPREPPAPTWEAVRRACLDAAGLAAEVGDPSMALEAYAQPALDALADAYREARTADDSGAASLALVGRLHARTAAARVALAAFLDRLATVEDYARDALDVADRLQAAHVATLDA